MRKWRMYIMEKAIDHVNVFIWRKTRRLLKLAAGWVGTSQVQFMHNAVMEKIERDSIPLPESIKK